MNYLFTKPRLVLLLLVLLLGGCASQVPLSIREAPADNPALEQVHAQTADYLGRPLRWGGTIIETVNKEAAT
jgi:outer membrane lipoprotein